MNVLEELLEVREDLGVHQSIKLILLCLQALALLLLLGVQLRAEVSFQGFEGGVGVLSLGESGLHLGDGLGLLACFVLLQLFFVFQEVN